MSKEMKRTKLVKNNNPGGCDFKGGVFLVEDNRPVSVNVTTERGSYELLKHPTLNIYVGECMGYKVHVSLKKEVGELRYWA